MGTQTVFRATNHYGENCHFGVASAARAWAGKRGKVERIDLPARQRFTAITRCTGDVRADVRARRIEEEYAGKLALMLECMLIDSTRNWNDAAELLSEYKAAWEEINPMPNVFLGEPMPPERKAILLARIAAREKGQNNG